MGAIPIAQEPTKQTCPEVLASGCVIWDGDDIPCLGLCKGAKITDAMYKEMVLLCQLLSQINGDLTALTTASTPPPIDFSVLNLGCTWSPTISQWTCPLGQVFAPTGTGTPPGYCGILGPAGSGIFYPGVGWVIAATSAVPVYSTVPNPTPRPTTLIGILQLIIDDIPCCNPCAANKGT